MKTLLLLPRIEPNTNPPLGIAYIASYLQKKNYEVEILDPTFESKNFVLDRLAQKDYEVLGINAYTMSYNLALHFANHVRQIHPKCKIIFGGIHPTILPDEVIKEKSADFVVIGEGEITTFELLQQIEGNRNYEKVDGIAYKIDGKIIINKNRELIRDINEIPFPARELLPMKKYLRANYGRSAWAVKQPSTNIVTTRGCPFKCSYCSSHLIFGYKCRYRSVDNILDEVEFLISEYDVKGLSIVDDTFIINKNHIYEFTEKIKSRKIKIEFICNGRVDIIDRDILKALKNAGCKGIAFGVESGSQYVLDNLLKKGTTLSQIKDAFRWAFEVGIPTDGYFMIGIPGETEENIKETIKFSKTLKASAANFAITIPMPKTELYDIALKHGEITAVSYDDYNYMGRPIFKAKNISQDKMNRYRKKALRSFYFRFGFIFDQLMSVRSANDLKQKSKGLFMLLKTIMK